MNYERVGQSYSYKQQSLAYQGQPLDASLSHGLNEQRRCRDVLCLIAFLLFWATLIIIAIVAFSRGQPHLLAAPFDSTGYQCGYSQGYQKYPYAYYNANNYSQFVCISECPTSNLSQPMCIFNNTITNCKSYTLYPTVRMVSFCFPTITPVGVYIDLGLSFYEQAMNDLSITWPIVLMTIFSALVVSLILMCLLRTCGGCLIIAVIVLYFGLLISFGVICLATAQNQLVIPGFQQWQDPDLLRKISYICFGTAILSLLTLLCNIKKLRIATVIIKTTAQFMQDQCQTIIVPIIMFIVMTLFFAVWIVTSIYIFSCGSVTKCGSSPYACIDWDVGVKRSLGVYFFGLFWNCQVAIGMCQFILASTTAYWYFSHLKGKLISSPVCRSFCRALTYHLGSIIFGAFVLCVLFVLQVAFEVFHRIAKNYSLSANPASNACLSCFIKYIRCCLACFQRFIRFITRNAFITMAITGQGFCNAAHQAFYLMFRSSSQYSITHGIGYFIMFFGKLLIATLCTLLGYLLITNIEQYSENIYSPFMPTVIFFVVSYVVASLFMDVFGIGSDTLLMCYCLELDVLKGLSYACPQAIKDALKKSAI